MTTGIVDWKQVDLPRGSGDGSQVIFKKLESGKSHRIRPVHKPMEIYKYYVSGEKRTRSAIVKDPDKCLVRENHPDLKPSLRYAINVIDREDEQLKVMEGPPTVFRAFRKWFEATGKAPGGEKGGDWVIDVEGKGLQTRYTCQFVESTEFTEEEIKKIDKGKGLWELPKIYAPHSPEDIERLLYGEDDESSAGRSQSSTPATPSSDNLFASEGAGVQAQQVASSSGGDSDSDSEMGW